MAIIQNIVSSYISHHQLLTYRQPILVAVSGGADSVVLLHLLNALGYRCTAAHCNFQLRGEESYRDEQFVRNLCRKWNIPLFVRHFHTQQISQQQGISIEMAARKLRYEWFDELAKQLNINRIAVGHHRDDSVETILLNILRGTGLRGLTGIAPLRNNIVRPLLCLTRQQVTEYAMAHNIDFVEDSSNGEDVFLRNKIRLHLLPLMQEISPSASESLCKMSQQLSSAYTLYQKYIHQIINHISEENRIYIHRLEQYPESETILFEMLHPLGFNSHQIKQIYESRNAHSGKVFLSPTHRLMKDRNCFLLSPVQANDVQEFTIENLDNLSHLPLKIKADILPAQSINLQKDPKILFADADKVQFPLTLRRWKQGDRFIPFGMKGQKKVSDFFSDNKFSLADKEDTWLLLSADGKIIWIVGHRSDNRFRISESTLHVLQMQVE